MFPNLQLCVVQAPVSTGRRSGIDRERASYLRAFAADVFSAGVPAVLTVRWRAGPALRGARAWHRPAGARGARAPPFPRPGDLSSHVAALGLVPSCSAHPHGPPWCGRGRAPPVPRHPCSSAALRLPAPFRRGSGSPCPRPPSGRALGLCPCGPTTRAPADASCAGDPAPARRHTGVSSRRGEGLPGSGTVLFMRALVAHPAGDTSPPRPEQPLHTGVVVPCEAIQRSRPPGSRGFGAAVPRPARSPASASLTTPFLASAPGLRPARAGSPLTGRIAHPLDDARSFMKSSHLQSPSTSRAWSHCISYPPTALDIPFWPYSLSPWKYKASAA
jgi:hypothetical protein